MLKLSDHKYAQCGVKIRDFDGGRTIDFYSYTTWIISAVYIEKEGQWFFLCTGTYSQTTRKQIGWFLKEFFPELCYFDMKAIAGDFFFDGDIVFKNIECGNILSQNEVNTALGKMII